MVYHDKTSFNCQGSALAGAACVVDLDNLCHRGFDKFSQLPIKQAQLNVLGFAAALRRRGMVEGTVCRNRDFTALGDQLWRKLGFRVVAARSNCDPQVVISLILCVEAGYRDLILAAGDGDYTHAVKIIRRCGVRVEVWSRRNATSRQLINAADDVRFVDDFLTAPPSPRDLVREAEQPTAS